MDFNLKNRHFLKLDDFTPQEISFLLQLATELKAAKYAGAEMQQLKGKTIALIFEKDSTHMRCGFEVAAFDQGSHVTYLGPGGSHIGHKETMKDTARALGRMYDGIEYCGYAQTLASETGARLTVKEDLEAAVSGCDFLYTDVWVSMGESPDLWGERIHRMPPYQVTRRLIAMTNNANTKFMHCLLYTIQTPKLEKISTRSMVWRRWRLQRRYSSRQLLSSSTRPRTGCTPLRQCL